MPDCFQRDAIEPGVVEDLLCVLVAGQRDGLAVVSLEDCRGVFILDQLTFDRSRRRIGSRCHCLPEKQGDAGRQNHRTELPPPHSSILRDSDPACWLYNWVMASITISQLDESTLERLQQRANLHGRSVEEEAGEILKKAVPEPAPDNLYDAIRQRVEPLGGFELPEIVRGPGREPPIFE